MIKDALDWICDFPLKEERFGKREKGKRFNILETAPLGTIMELVYGAISQLVLPEKQEELKVEYQIPIKQKVEQCLDLLKCGWESSTLHKNKVSGLLYRIETIEKLKVILKSMV